MVYHGSGFIGSSKAFEKLKGVREKLGISDRSYNSRLEATIMHTYALRPFCELQRHHLSHHQTSDSLQAFPRYVKDVTAMAHNPHSSLFGVHSLPLCRVMVAALSPEF